MYSQDNPADIVWQEQILQFEGLSTFSIMLPEYFSLYIYSDEEFHNSVVFYFISTDAKGNETVFGGVRLSNYLQKAEEAKTGTVYSIVFGKNTEWIVYETIFETIIDNTSGIGRERYIDLFGLTGNMELMLRVFSTLTKR